jgi:hypothetical protein
MVPSGSLQRSQKPVYGLYSEPDESAPHPLTQTPSLRYILILPSDLRLHLQSDLFPSKLSD